MRFIWGETDKKREKEERRVKGSYVVTGIEECKIFKLRLVLAFGL